MLARSGVDPQSVKGIGFDATCSLVVLDKDSDAPISVCSPGFKDTTRNVMMWMDHRPQAETQAINATKHKLLKYVGGGMSIEMEIPKVLWLKNNMPSELFARCKFYDLVDALTHLATGTETRSFCSAVCKQGYVPVGVDGSVKGWQADFLAAINLPELVENNFEKMGGAHGDSGSFASAGDYIGRLSARAAKDLGLHTGVCIGSGVIDAYAGWIGSVGACPTLDALQKAPNGLQEASHRLAAVAGTSTCHLVMSAAPVFVPGVWGPYRDVLLPNMWLAEGGQSSTGSLLQNVLTTHPAHTQALTLAAAANTSIFEFLHNHLVDLQTASNAPSLAHLTKHLFVYGDKHGNRSPIADPSMRGAVVGLSFDISLDDLALQYYAVLEFIALQTRHIVDTMNAAGHDIRVIFISGGQSKNSILMTLIADATGMPIVQSRYVNETVVLGAAMLGARAATGEGLWEIMGRMSAVSGRVETSQDEGVKRLVEAKYKVFLKMAEAQREYRRIIDEAIAG